MRPKAKAKFCAECGVPTGSSWSPRCPTHRAERERERDRQRARDRGGRVYNSRRVHLSATPERPFAFDAIKEALPPALRQAERGVTEPGWWGYLAAAYCSMHPESNHKNARQHIGRLRGQYIDPFSADSWAIAIGLHPSEIWDDWHTAMDLIDDDLMVVAGTGA